MPSTCCVLPVLIAQVLAAPPLTAPIAFTDVSVLAMDSPSVQGHRTVLISNGRITAIGAVGRVAIPKEARVIDGRGKYLMPGLADMHVHLSDAAELPVFVGYGVLTVRDLNGSPRTLAWRDSAAAGTLLGPRLFVSGPMLASAAIPWNPKVVPTSPAEAEAAVVAQHAAGYDQIKLYDGLPPAVFAAAVQTAKRLGLRSSGHIPVDVGFDGVLASGMDGLEHLDKTVAQTVGHDLDTTKIPSIVERIRKSGMWVTPTLMSMAQLSAIGSGRFDSLMNIPEARNAPESVRAYWTSIVGRLKGNRPIPAGTKYGPWADFQLRLAGALARAGVPMMAGTDLPNALLSPGHSLLGELDVLVEAGLTPFQAVEAATSAPARFFGQSADWGTVAVGQRANLLLLDANPLLGFATFRDPRGVVLNGAWLDAEALRRLRPKSGSPSGSQPAQGQNPAEEQP